MKLKHLTNKQGSQMAEAAIAMPVMILAAMLLLRLFVFCLDVLTTDISEHEKALSAQDAYSGVLIRSYEEDSRVVLLAGGLLEKAASKRIHVKAYLINEDFLVRSGEILD